MRSVMFAVVVVIAIIVTVVMKSFARDRSERIVEMRFSGEMNGDEIDVEREQQRGEQTAPPTCPCRRAETMRSASASHQWRESSCPVRLPSIIEFSRGTGNLWEIAKQDSQGDGSIKRRRRTNVLSCRLPAALTPMDLCHSAAGAASTR